MEEVINIEKMINGESRKLCINCIELLFILKKDIYKCQKYNKKRLITEFCIKG